MTRQYCSLADHRYLPQLLALYGSLREHSSEPFNLWVLPMDEECRKTLRYLSLSGITLITPETFESDMNLREFRESRTRQEYCWTCASHLCEWLLSIRTTDLYGDSYPLKPRCEEVTYLDADLCFFSDPAPVFEEIGERSIAITPHRLIPSKQHLAANGKFNVGWVTFKNTEAGRACVSTWAAQCRARCSATVGCGDQQYLDEWPATYGDEVCVIQNIGVNCGPWSLANWQVTEGPELDGVPLVAFHFHETRLSNDGSVRLTNYALRPDDVKFIYDPYVVSVRKANERIMAAQSCSGNTGLDMVSQSAQPTP